MKMGFAVLALGLVLSGAACAEPRHRPDLDFLTPKIGQSEHLVPKSFKPNKGCTDPKSFEDCIYENDRGVAYSGDENRNILSKSISRKGGRFLEKLPFGLKGDEREAEVRAIMRKHGVALELNTYQGVRELSSRGFDNGVPGPEGPTPFYLFFQFQAAGRLSTVGVALFDTI